MAVQQTPEALKAAREAAKAELETLYELGILERPQDHRGNKEITPAERLAEWVKAIKENGVAESRIFGITAKDRDSLKARMAYVQGLIAGMESPKAWATKTEAGNLDKDGKFVAVDPSKPAKTQVFTHLRHGIVKA